MSEKIVATDGHEGHWYTGEEIVRCRDCRFFEETGNCTWFECGTCGMQGEVTENGFCAWGERKDVDA